MSSLFSRKILVSFLLVLATVATSGLLFSHLARAGAGSWYDSGWQHRIKITVDHTKVGANLTNFPVYVDLSKLPASFFQDVRSDGGDIRITTSDGTTLVPREVVTIDTGSKTGELHFKAPSLSSSTDFGFYIYYDNPSATEPSANATYGSQNVWSNGYAAVWHMDTAIGITPNLLTNPGAENGTVGWTAGQNGGMSISKVSTAYGRDTDYLEGKKFFYPSGNGTTDSSQEVDLSTKGYTNAQLDTGNIEFTFSGFTQRNDGTDKAELTMEFLNASDTVLASSTTGEYFPPHINVWGLISTTHKAPTGTRKIRVTIRSIWVGGNVANVAFDALILQEGAERSGKRVKDSTANKNDGEIFGTTESNTPIAKGQSFDGSSQIYIPHDSALELGTNNLTISTWINPNTITEKHAILDNGDSSNAAIRFFQSDGSGDKLKLIRGSSYDDGASSNAVITKNEWQRVVVTTSGNTASFYRNGVSVGSDSLKHSSWSNNRGFHIGYRAYKGSSVGYFEGSMDEMRISSVGRSADWLATEYNNQNAPATFYTVSSPEAGAPGGGSATTTQGVMHSTNYKIVRDSINIGGSEEGSSANYRIRDSVGQSAPGESASVGYNLYAGYRHMASSTASSSISISLASSSVTLSPSVSGISGGVGDATAQWTVTTDNSAGYTLEVAASSSPALQSDSSSFADYASASSTPDFNWAVAPSTSAFGFSPEGNDITTDFLDNGTICGAGANDTALRCWSGFSTTPATIAKSTAPTAPSGNTTTLHLRAEVGTTKLQESGNYAAVITATALAN